MSAPPPQGRRRRRAAGLLSGLSRRFLGWGRPWEWVASRRWEAAAIAASLAAAAAVVLGRPEFSEPRLAVFAPILLWTALRLGPGATVLLMAALGLGIHARTDLSRGALLSVGLSAVFLQLLAAVVAERRSSAAAAAQQSKILTQVVNSISEGLVVADSEGRFTHFNPAAERIVGFGSLDAPPSDWSAEYGLFYPDRTTPFPENELPLVRAIRGEACDGVEIFVRNGRIRQGAFISVSSAPLRNHEGDLIGGVAVFRDITQQKESAAVQTRHKDELLSANRELDLQKEALHQSLREKEALLREIHHRVKNNLQVVSSLLNMQSRSLKDPADKVLFEESQSRVRTMALIHEKLYQSKDFDRVDFREYLKTLTADLLRSYPVQANAVRLSLDVYAEPLSINTAIPLALIVNELMSNTLKYAFPNRGEGEIRISLSRKGDGLSCLEISDNGKGLPPDLDLSQSHSLGLQIVRALAQQLKGEISAETGPGARWRMTFPVPAP